MSQLETTRRGFLGLLGAAVTIPAIPLNLAAPAEAAVNSSPGPALPTGKWCLSVADDRGRWRYLLGLTQGEIMVHQPMIEADYVLGSPPVRIPRPYAPRQTTIEAEGYAPDLAALDTVCQGELMLGLKRYRLDLGDHGGAYELEAFLDHARLNDLMNNRDMHCDPRRIALSLRGAGEPQFTQGA